MISMSSVITRWTAVKMTGPLMGPLLYRLPAQIPIDNENLAALPHARLALQTPCFDETTHSSAPTEPNTSASTNSNCLALVAREIDQ